MFQQSRLPESLTEYLQVWCGDLLAVLSPQNRHALIESIRLVCDGGVSWPTRHYVQRMVELAQGVVTEEAVQGELLELYAGGVDAVLLRMRDLRLRRAALRELGYFQPTPFFLQRMRAALEHRDITSAEYAEAMRRSLHQPSLPEIVPPPAHLGRLPAGYPLPRPGEIPEDDSIPSEHRTMPAMVSYVPHRMNMPPIDRTQGSARVRLPSRPAGSSWPDDSTVPKAPFHDAVDGYLRSRGWRSLRFTSSGPVDQDHWVWPPSEQAPWTRPTTVDYDGERFRVRLATKTLIEPVPTQYLVTVREIQREIDSIEEWTQPPL